MKGQSEHYYAIRTRRPSGNGEAHDGTRGMMRTGASQCAVPQRWRCPNRLFLGTNHETSCIVNTCHHRCFSVGGHAEGGPRYTYSKHRFRAPGARDTYAFYSAFTYFWICRSTKGSRTSPDFWRDRWPRSLKLGGLEAGVKFGEFQSRRYERAKMVFIFIPVREIRDRSKKYIPFPYLVNSMN